MPAKKKELPAKARKVLTAYRNNGQVMESCKLAGVGRSSFYYWKQTYSEFAEVVKEVDEEIVDKAVCGLLKLIEKGDLGAIIWALKCKGKERGWYENKDTVEMFNSSQVAALFKGALGLGNDSRNSNKSK